MRTLFFACCIVFMLYQASSSSCGYEACPAGKLDMLNVHIIMHTHDDVGWLHTVDSYYEMWVREIITSVVQTLMQNENRRFIYVESAFFTRWWEEQTDLTKEIVRRLVNDGRLEFISGGWSMNDEATTHYLAIIDQMTLGLRFLNETFGVCGRPKVGWQIDTFGHSREQASLFAQMKFDGLFLGRLHYQDKTFRERTKTMEFIWKSSQSLGESSDIFTGVLPNVYWPPKGFCFDTFCNDEELTEDNINYKAHSFIATAQEQAKHYATNHIVMTMGMDFHFRDAPKWFRNMDYLIEYVNSLQAVGMKVNMFYSTPTCYLHSLHESNKSWTKQQSDFFPYASGRHEYWTGYYTSRPALKYHARRANAFLQACKQLIALADVKNADSLTLKKALGVIQHHDGITGTEKQHVSDDYSKMLYQGYELCEDAVGKAMRLLLSNDTILPRLDFCEHLNVSQCVFTELERQFLVVAYNPLAHPVRTYLRLPVMREGYSVRQVNKRRRSVPAQVLPIPPSVISLPERSSLAVNELVFPISLPPLGFSVYGVQIQDDYEPELDIESERMPFTVQDTVIQNENLKVVIDGFSGLMKEIIFVQSNQGVPVKQSFYYYEGMPGYRMERASGAYAFNPQHDTAYPLAENITYRVFKGPLVEEVHQFYAPWITQIIRLYKGQNHIEFDWIIGPIPVHDHIGREIITRFDTDLENNGIFYTDSNARETIKRARDHQENFPWNITEKIAGNYYPVTSWIYIRDEARNLQLSLLTDRCEGGGSIVDGSIELMLHRRLLFDDGYGVNEALNEPGFDGRGLVVRGSHYLTLGPIDDMTPLNKRLTKIRFHTPVLGFARIPYSNLSRYSLNDFRGLKRRLPHNVHLLTLEKLDDHRILLRLEHFYEVTDEPERTVTVSLNNLFRPFRVIYFQETTLSANKYLYEVEKLKWRSQDDEDAAYENELPPTPANNELADVMESEANEGYMVNDSEDDHLRITLKPMQIRTFILKIDYNAHY
ncbi:lysosomal alpha-mannosidase-like [Argiope bruennichi]|uniref:lysosomal alpha-mannosidase-like n=1 Tax=Argiope bruennichi TaxID=94029 RepID=UPI002493D2E7|nr:lysosomal alpha-mannosidase-like [Argiope bruennichi]XP_055937638.1 lysosomal alpha-mannosidase-like [Argiope bruennichi]XP_055937648.1 lysosomal alpha-mannosidase-like [Argiope bruennichi]